ncbi:MAG TPA: DUF2249 domain-containing protein [Flavipsychrobacter sp.]
MITILPGTKISVILKANADAIEAIASINPHFNKLRNPLLRKILASRVTVSEAAKIGKCSIECFAEKLRPLGFDLKCEELCNNKEPSDVYKDIEHHAALDVRKDLVEGKDPFNIIIKALEKINAGETLLLVNSFTPFPLIKILERKGYTITVRQLADDIVHTYLQKPQKALPDDIDDIHGYRPFEELIQLYDGKMVITDVRHLPMPQPMLHILEQLEQLPAGKALFVYHKKIPMFLLPELKQNGYKYAIKEDADAILMLIYKDKYEAA